jgi:hypothetical protein
MACAGDWRGPPRGKPCFDFSQIPYDTSWREREASRELTALLHLIDRAVGERHHFAQLLPTNGPFDWRVASMSHRYLQCYSFEEMSAMGPERKERKVGRRTAG